MKRILLTIALSATMSAQNWNGIISSTRASDWSTAGVLGGIPYSTEVQCGPTITAGASTTTINNALAGTGAGYTGCTSLGVQYYIKLGVGTFTVTGSGIKINRANITLRGSGANQTILSGAGNGVCSAGMGYSSVVSICTTDSSGIGGAGGINWTAGYAQGNTTLTVASTSTVTPGSTLVFLDQCDDGFTGTACTTGSATDTTNYFVCSAVCSTEGTGTNAYRTNRSQIQIVVPTSKTSTSITIPSPGIIAPQWRTGQSPQYWVNQALVNAGIEDLTIDTTTSGADGVNFWGCYNCWARGVKVIQPSSKSSVRIVLSSHVSVTDGYIFCGQSRPSDPYPIQAQITSDLLIQNNIIQQGVSPIVFNGPDSGSVVAYNFTILNNAGSQGSWSFWNHSSGIAYQLFEGNIAAGFANDEIHGTHNMITRFRNYFRGKESTNVQQINPDFEGGYNRYSNIIGNVLGSSLQTVYTCTTNCSTNPSNEVYILGWGNTLPDDPITVNTSYRWGNWDNVTNAVRWCTDGTFPCSGSEVPSALSIYSNPVPADHTLPSSFYLNAKPSWFVNSAWPAIGPDVSSGNISGLGGHANKIPAQVCYESIGGPSDGSGSALPNFNAEVCYNPIVPSTTPAPSIVFASNRRPR